MKLTRRILHFSNIKEFEESLNFATDSHNNFTPSKYDEVRQANPKSKGCKYAAPTQKSLL